MTVVLAAGGSLRTEPTEGADVAFLPPGHPIATATHEIEELFGDSSEISVVTLIFRGEALTPGGLSQMSSLINDIVSEPGVGELLAPGHPIFAPSFLIGSALQVNDFESVTQEQIDSVRNVPEIQGALAFMTGTDDGRHARRHCRHPLDQHGGRACPEGGTEDKRACVRGRRPTAGEQPVADSL